MSLISGPITVRPKNLQPLRNNPGLPSTFLSYRQISSLGRMSTILQSTRVARHFGQITVRPKSLQPLPSKPGLPCNFYDRWNLTYTTIILEWARVARHFRSRIVICILRPYMEFLTCKTEIFSHIIENWKRQPFFKPSGSKNDSNYS